MKIIVTGASRGIGRGIASFLAAEGFQVGLLARSGDLLDEARREIQSRGGTCHVEACDIRDPAATRTAIGALVASLGGVDGLINNAGIVIRKDIFSLSDEEWRAMVDTNLGGVFHATRAVLPHMRSQARGHIINISSISGRMPLAGGSGYAATKFGVTGFSDSLLLEVREHGIKVTTVFPGSVDTESHRKEGEAAGWKLTPGDVGRACRDVLLASPASCISRIELRPLQPPRAT